MQKSYFKKNKKKDWTFFIPKILPNGQAPITIEDNRPSVIRGIYRDKEEGEIILSFKMTQINGQKDKYWPKRQNWEGPIFLPEIYKKIQKTVYACYLNVLNREKKKFVEPIKTVTCKGKTPHYRFKVKAYESLKKRKEILANLCITYGQGEIFIGPNCKNQEKFPDISSAIKYYQDLIISISADSMLKSKNRERLLLHEMVDYFAKLYKLIRAHKENLHKNNEFPFFLVNLKSLIKKYEQNFKKQIAKNLLRTFPNCHNLKDQNLIEEAVAKIKTSILIIESRDHSIDPNFDVGKDLFLQNLYTISDLLEFEKTWMHSQLKNAAAQLRVSQRQLEKDEHLISIKEIDNRLEKARQFCINLEANHFFSPAQECRTFLQKSRRLIRQNNFFEGLNFVDKAYGQIMPLF